MISGKWQVESGKWKVGEPDDGTVKSSELRVKSSASRGEEALLLIYTAANSEPNDSTNFGSHANPGIGSHFGQTKFLAIHSASPKIKRLRSGLVAHLDGRK